jgi:hypothetical protein
VIRGRSARLVALALLPLLAASWAAAEEDAAGVSGQGEQESGHQVAGVGGFAGLTGPARYGLAAEAQMYPARWPGQVLSRHFGLGVRYRGYDGLASGLIAAGLVYQAGATRPHFVLELHGDLGLAYGPAEPLLGGGVRLQLGVWGPVAVAVAADIYYWFDGERPRPITVPAVIVGLAR